MFGVCRTVKITLLVNYRLWKISRFSSAGSNCPSAKLRLAVPITWLEAPGVAPSCSVSTFAKVSWLLVPSLLSTLSAVVSWLHRFLCPSWGLDFWFDLKLNQLLHHPTQKKTGFLPLGSLMPKKTHLWDLESVFLSPLLQQCSISWALSWNLSCYSQTPVQCSEKNRIVDCSGFLFWCFF